MVFNKEMDDILSYLDKRKDYAIFAGFASYLHTGIESSADIDIYVGSARDVKAIASDFRNAGWKFYKKFEVGRRYYTESVEKNKTTLDIIFSNQVRDVFLPDKVRVVFKRHKLYVISRESLFIARMASITSLNRDEHKQKRDRIVISMLRPKLNLKKLKNQLAKMNDIFWRHGYV